MFLQPWYRYFDLSPPEIGELINLPNAGKLVHKLVHFFPKLQYVNLGLPSVLSNC